VFSGLDQSDIINIAHKLPAWYADDTNSVGWIMRAIPRSVLSRALQGNFFSFQPTPSGSMESLYGKGIAVTDTSLRLALVTSLSFLAICSITHLSKTWGLSMHVIHTCIKQTIRLAFSLRFDGVAM
jgi:hypothetical protein